MANNKTPISWLLDALETSGLSRFELMDHVGLSVEQISQDQVESEDGLFATLSQYNALCAYASEALQEPAIGLAILDHVGANEMGLIGLLTQQGPTMRKSLINLSVYQPIFSTNFVWSLEEKPELTRLLYRVDGATQEDSRHDIEFSMGIVVETLKRSFPGESGLLSAEFAYTAPADITRYQDLFGSKVTFGSNRNAIAVQNELLDLPLPDTDPRLSVILETQAKRVLEDLNEKPDLIRQVETIIALGLGQGSIGIEDVAGRLYVHPRTLHRRLIQHGTSFRQLKDNIVIRSAQDALLQTSLSVTEIALNLGYSENSAFTRTFKRICDISPLQYRRIGREVI